MLKIQDNIYILQQNPRTNGTRMTEPRGVFDEYERRQVRLYDAFPALRSGDYVRFATVQKTRSVVTEVTVTGNRAEARIAAPWSDGEYLQWVDRGAGERGDRGVERRESDRSRGSERCPSRYRSVQLGV
jgi:hypothetical protein